MVKNVAHENTEHMLIDAEKPTKSLGQRPSLTQVFSRECIFFLTLNSREHICDRLYIYESKHVKRVGTGLKIQFLQKHSRNHVTIKNINLDLYLK